jgi:LPXTG-motif cell wall-anchored protein
MTAAVRSVPRAVALVLAVAALLAGGLVASQSVGMQSARAVGNVVFDSVPAPLAGHYVSLAFQSSTASEFGELIQPAGTDRVLDEVTVVLESWACEVGAWNLGTCVTTPGTSFAHPITINVYAEGDGTLPGALLATVTQDVAVPFRPTTDQACQNGGYLLNAVCVNGVAFAHTFSLTALNFTLPSTAIVAVAFNTQGYGAEPIGAAGPYNYLNVAVVPSGPSVGTDPEPDVVYANFVFGPGNYNDGGAGGTGFLRSDADWAPNRLGLTVTAHTAQAALPATGPGDTGAFAGIGALVVLAGAGLLLVATRRRVLHG